MVGQLEEICGHISGKTIEEVKANLVDALDLYLEVQKDLTELIIAFIKPINSSLLSGGIIKWQK